MAVTVTPCTIAAVQNTNFTGPTNATFTSINGGTSFTSGQKVVIGFSCNQGITAITGVTVGGNNATLAESGALASNGTALYYYDVTSTTTDTIVVLGGGANTSYICAFAYILTGASTGAPSASNNDVNTGSAGPLSASLAIPSGGAAIVTYGAYNIATTTLTWSNATQDFTQSTTGHLQLTGAHSTTSGTNTITATGSQGFGEDSLAMAAWGPAGAAAIFNFSLLGVGP